MVDESLKAYLLGKLSEAGCEEEKTNQNIDILLGYSDEDIGFTEREVKILLDK